MTILYISRVAVFKWAAPIRKTGGWNDFAKNMRSAYRAAGQADMKSYNLGIGWLKENGIEEQ